MGGRAGCVREGGQRWWSLDGLRVVGCWVEAQLAACCPLPGPPSSTTHVATLLSTHPPPPGTPTHPPHCSPCTPVSKTQFSGTAMKTRVAGQLALSPGGAFCATADRHSLFVWRTGADIHQPLNLHHTRPYTVGGRPRAPGRGFGVHIPGFWLRIWGSGCRHPPAPQPATHAAVHGGRGVAAEAGKRRRHAAAALLLRSLVVCVTT